MATIPYMQLYVADYLADTPHLDTEEHGAYLLLLLNYWHTEKPLPTERLQRICKIQCNERWSVVQQTLKYFFEEHDGFWFHSRVEKDLEKVYAKSKQASKAGKKSAKVRRAKAIEKSNEKNGRSTSVKVSLNHKEKEKTNTSSSKKDDGQFALFWNNYPKKVDKKQAEQKFNRLTWSNQNLAIADCMTRFKDTPKQFVPSPRKYIIGENWNDESITTTGQNNETTKRKTSSQIFADATKSAFS